MKRTVRPEKAVQGKTESNKKSKGTPINDQDDYFDEVGSSAKRRPLKNLSNVASADHAVIVIASPNTSKAILKNIRAEKDISNVLTPSRISKSDETSPGGGPQWVQTNTARKRRFERDRDFTVERNFPDAEKKICRSLLFAERLRKNPTILKTSEKELTEHTFGPCIITLDDLKKVPLRKTVLKQNGVMGEPADMAVRDLFDEKLPTKFHWSHILAFVLLAGKINTQVAENLFAGTDKSNWTKKFYEMSLHEILSKNKDVVSIELCGSVNLLGDTLLGINERLDYKINLINGAFLEGSLHFDTLLLETESSLGSKIFTATLTSLIEIDTTPSLSCKK